VSTSPPDRHSRTRGEAGPDDRLTDHRRRPGRPLSPALDTTFKIGLVLKGLDGILEVIGGIVLLFLSPQAIQHLARTLTAHEPCGTRPRPAPGHSPQVLTGDRVRIADRGDSAAPRRG